METSLIDAFVPLGYVYVRFLVSIIAMLLIPALGLSDLFVHLRVAT
jgi:hypothetical protein